MRWRTGPVDTSTFNRALAIVRASRVTQQCQQDMTAHRGRKRSYTYEGQDWCDDIRAVIVVRLRADEPGADPNIADAAAQFLAPEFDALAEELFTAALGRGLLHLPKFALPEAAEER